MTIKNNNDNTPADDLKYDIDDRDKILGLLRKDLGPGGCLLHNCTL